MSAGVCVVFAVAVAALVSVSSFFACLIVYTFWLVIKHTYYFFCMAIEAKHKLKQRMHIATLFSRQDKFFGVQGRHWTVSSVVWCSIDCVNDSMFLEVILTKKNCVQFWSIYALILYKENKILQFEIRILFYFCVQRD